MSDAKIECIVSEPPATKRQRVLLTDRIKKVEDGQGHLLWYTINMRMGPGGGRLLT